MTHAKTRSQGATIEGRDETERLKEVYAEYEASRGVRSRWSEENPGTHAIVEERNRVTREALASHGYFPLNERQILDVGCGTGGMLGELRRWGALPSQLTGIDLLPGYIEAARANEPEVTFLCGSAAELPFADASFDLVLAFTVFSSLLDLEVARAVAGSMNRVLRPGGAVVWYDLRHGNPSNRNVRGIRREELSRLFPEFDPRLGSVTVLPPLARRLGRLTPTLYPVLGRLPFLRTHLAGLMLKPEGRPAAVRASDFPTDDD